MTAEPSHACTYRSLVEWPHLFGRTSLLLTLAKVKNDVGGAEHRNGLGSWLCWTAVCRVVDSCVLPFVLCSLTDKGPSWPYLPRSSQESRSLIPP